MKTTIKTERKRTVFGKVRLGIDDKAVQIRMTRKELIIRPLHARRLYRMPLEKVAMHVMANAPMTPAVKQVTENA